MAEPLKLDFTDTDRHSAGGQKLTKYLEARLSQLRIRNDVERSDEQTANLRGRIAEIKKLFEFCEGRQSTAE